ncbi:PREDICTED: calcitonin receptor [Miniopterus natalensis]|uniref:calcitonin receptor n=1 Tax=Miniopterus natalensis TaxID=291302 RepID=UPI0007A6EBA1|nr:PREDICTED: calcitonin receptor [Miniopterus natalensis]
MRKIKKSTSKAKMQIPLPFPRWCFILLIFMNYPTLVLPNTTVTPTEPQSFLHRVGQKKLMDAETRCYRRMRALPPYRGEGPFCNRTWDGWLCWDDTPAGITSQQQCPNYFPDFDSSEMASKSCDENGVWYKEPVNNETWSNYSRCYAFSPEKMRNAYILYYVAIVGHSTSLFTLSISLAIFVYFKNLGCQRVSIHKHMFLTYILNSITILIHLIQVVPNGKFVNSNPVSCKVLNFVNLYMMSCNYFWMLCEGIYLHTLIVVSVFAEKQHMKWYYLLGWGFPLVPTTIHAITRVLYFNDNCWLSVDTHLLYIIHGPVMAALVVNFFFLLNIVRVLVKKMKENHQPDVQLYLKAVRATLFLVPLLGVQFVVFPWRPETRILGLIYDYMMHFLIHFQGFFVAVIYCFYNNNVQTTLKRQWNLLKIRWEQRFGSPNRNYRRRPNGGAHDVRSDYNNMLMAMAAAASDGKEGGLPVYICHQAPKNDDAEVAINLGEEVPEAIPMEVIEQESCA